MTEASFLLEVPHDRCLTKQLMVALIVQMITSRGTTPTCTDPDANPVHQQKALDWCASHTPVMA